MIGLDTNVLLRAAVQDDAVQSPVARAIIAELAPSKPGYVNAVVLAEFAWTLERRYGYSPIEIVGAIETMLESEAFVVANHDAVGRALERVSTDGMTLSDAMIGELNFAAGCATTMTFDRRAAISDLFELADRNAGGT